MKGVRIVSTSLSAFWFAAGVSSTAEANLENVFSTPPIIERQTPTTEIPFDPRLGKIFIEASINQDTRTFIFDTGSPTILTKDFAQTLDLTLLGQNTGLDANGNEVTMDIAVVDTVSLDGLTFRDVPVLVFDHNQLELGPCLFDGGVIGSEILPGSQWQIDAQDQTITISEPNIPRAISEDAIIAPMHDFGYPHTPIVDYSVGTIKDKAIFDTGNVEDLVLFKRVSQNPTVQKRIVNDSTIKGRGSEGVSAGGRGPVRNLVRFTIEDVELGANPIAPLRATTRPTAPTLLGAGLLDHYVVTLDYPSSAFILEARAAPDPQRGDSGYAISYEDGKATVTQIFKRSNAARAGLRLGDQIVSINGRPMNDLDEAAICESVFWLGETFDRTAAAQIVIERSGKTKSIQIPALEK